MIRRICQLVFFAFAFAATALSADSLMLHVPQDSYPIFPRAELLSSDIVAQAKDFSEISQLKSRMPLPSIRGILSLSFNNEMTWVRFLVENPGPAPVDLVLISAFPIYKMQLIETNRPLIRHQTGFSLGKNVDRYSLFASMNLTVFPGKNTYLIGINSSGHPFVPIFELHSDSSWQRYENTHMIFALAAFGGLIAVWLFSFSLALTLRNKTYAYSFVLAFAYLGFESEISSLPHVLMPPLSIYWASLWPVFCALLLIMYLMMTKTYFAHVMPEYKGAQRIINIAIQVSVVYPFVHYISPLFFGTAYILFQLFAWQVPIFIGFNELRYKRSHAAFFLTGSIPLGIIAIVFILQIIGVIPYDLVIIKVRIILAIFLGIMISIGYSAVLAEIRLAHQSLRSGLKGIIAEGQVNRILMEGIRLKTAPLEQRATVMFIDIVGFSEAAMQRSAEKSFASFKDVISNVAAIIHRYDGIVDKSLGDGVVCVFGHNVMGIGGADHELRALRSAIEIQSTNINKIIHHAGLVGDTVFPLRIGINTDLICIGNIGNTDRIEIALSGNGVVLAKRFEGACEPHKIIMGKATYDGLPVEIKEEDGYCQRYVPIKHQVSLELSYEYDPFFKQPKLVSRARQAYWNAQGATQHHHRFNVGLAELSLEGQYGVMKVGNFSVGGFCMRSGVFLGKGVVFDLKLTAVAEKDKLLQLLDPVKVEVIWGAPNVLGGYDLGVRLIGLNESQKEHLFNALKRHMTRMFAYDAGSDSEVG